MSVKVSEQEFNMMLVEAVRKHPCLYNTNSPDYTRKDVVEQSWLDIGRAVNESVQICKLRWKNIRTVFVRKIKCEKIGFRKKQHKPYYLRNVLQFLVPFLKLTTSSHATDGLEYIKIENNELQAQDDDDDDNCQLNEAISNDGFSDMEFNQVEQTEITYQTETVDNIELEDQSNVDPIESNTLTPAKGIKRKNNEDQKDEDDDNDDQFFEFCNRSSHKIDEFDPKKMFLMSLLPEMHQMNNQQTRKFKRKVLEIIDDILEDKPL